MSLFIMVHKLQCSVINNYILVSLKVVKYITLCIEKTSEYDQEIPKSQTTDQPTVPRHKQILFDYSLHNQALGNVQSTKYIGTTITYNMDWVSTIQNLSQSNSDTWFPSWVLGFLHLGVLRKLHTKLKFCLN